LIIHLLQPGQRLDLRKRAPSKKKLWNKTSKQSIIKS
jgi:hypothetical protein